MTPNQEKLQKRVFASMASQCNRRGYAAPVDVLIEIGVLRKEKENEWRAGKIDYLERACMMNLSKLAFIMKQIRLYARDHQLKPSWTSYHQSGKKGNNKPLRFSKSGNEQIERAYATHYVDQKRIAQLKQKKAEQTDKQRAEKQSGTQSVG